MPKRYKPNTRLLALLKIIEGSDNSFAKSLTRQFKKFGGLTKPQYAKLPTLVEQLAKEKASESKGSNLRKIKAIGKRSLESIPAMLNRAYENDKKYPKLVFGELEGIGKLVVTRMGDRSKMPGGARLTNGGRYGSDRYRFFGTITPDGVWEIGRRHPEEFVKTLASFLRKLAIDPAKVTAEYGHASGKCCFCSQDLSDETSVALGRGPVCSKNHGLPYGKKAVKKLSKAS